MSANKVKLVGRCILNVEEKQISSNSIPCKYRYYTSNTHIGPNVVDNDNAQTLQASKLPSSFSNIFDKLKSRVNQQKDEGIDKSRMKWKNADSLVSMPSISSRTRHLLNSILSTNDDFALCKRIEDLAVYVKQYPEARNGAVKEGAIRLLLRVRANTKDPNVHSEIREALALLGYTDPLPSQGIRILSIDGGGIRGLLVLQMLKKLEELTGKPVHEMFDIICGVSTGAILAFSLAIHRKSLDEVATGYKELSTKVFKQSPLWGTGNLVWSHSYYDTSLWEKMLKEQLGEEKLIRTARDPSCPKLCAVSAVVNQSRLSAYIFRNYSLPWKVQSYYSGGNDHEVWQAVRASAAAPTYFEEFKIGNLLHQDGGILVNNPTAIGLHEAKLIWPGSPIQCVISFGTGRTIPSPTQAEETQSLNNTTWANKFFKILDSATDTEAVHTVLNDLLPDKVYYRFNPYLTEMVSMVETDPKKLETLENDAVMYLRRNDDKFQAAAKALVQNKTFTQKATDWLKLKKILYSFSSFDK